MDVPGLSQEGPSVFRTETLSCGMCKYHEQFMRQSGLNPVYDHYCKHPDRPAAMRGLLEKDMAWIGQSDSTPEWCPFLNPARDAIKAERETYRPGRLRGGKA